MITNFDNQMFAAARKQAKKSDFENFHVGCVIVYKRHIIGAASNSNKTHPMQAYYNKYRKFHKTQSGIKHSMHAEIAAINSVPYPVGKEIDWSKVKIYIWRICPGKPGLRGLARPCPGCAKALRDLGIRDVYYTTDKGFAYEKFV